MKSEGSLPCSQVPTTDPYPELDESSPHLPALFPKIRFSIIFPPTPSSSASSQVFHNS